MYKVEMNAGQMKYIREFFDGYQDDKVKLTVSNSLSRVKTIYDVETELSKEDLTVYLKTIFKTSKHAAALYYTINVL